MSTLPRKAADTGHPVRASSASAWKVSSSISPTTARTVMCDRLTLNPPCSAGSSEIATFTSSRSG